jgi:hypothetical protein
MILDHTTTAGGPQGNDSENVVVGEKLFPVGENSFVIGLDGFPCGPEFFPDGQLAGIAEEDQGTGTTRGRIGLFSAIRGFVIDSNMTLHVKLIKYRIDEFLRSRSA